eukprot:3056973-Amphidinium_carterae.1
MVAVRGSHLHQGQRAAKCAVDGLGAESDSAAGAHWNRISDLHSLEQAASHADGVSFSRQ